MIVQTMALSSNQRSSCVMRVKRVRFTAVRPPTRILPTPQVGDTDGKFFVDSSQSPALDGPGQLPIASYMFWYRLRRPLSRACSHQYLAQLRLPTCCCGQTRLTLALGAILCNNACIIFVIRFLALYIFCNLSCFVFAFARMTSHPLFLRAKSHWTDGLAI